MRESCWLRKGCPCQTGSCSTSQPLDDGCPVYRWFGEIFDGSKWISVNEKLPEVSGIKVLVAAKMVKESVLQTKAVFTAFIGYGDQKWYAADNEYMASPKIGNNEVHPVWEITHWMFLPEAPKEAT